MDEPKDTFSLEKKDVETRIEEMTKTGLLREGVVCLCKIWRSLELLAFLGMAAMLLWCGARVSNLASFRDALETIIIGLAAALFGRIGWSLPNSRAKEVVDRLTRLK